MLKVAIFAAGAVIGGIIALVYSDVINVAILKYLPPQPAELQDDPYSEAFGETWRTFPS